MKKVVFLHGAGADKEAYHELMLWFANKNNAELISFNAPFPHNKKPNKYVWFNKFIIEDRRDVNIEEYCKSVEYIKTKILELDTPLSDIIIIGHSQGGGMACELALCLKLKAVISICGDMPYNLEYKNEANTPIYWLEAGQDGYIDDNRKQSYKLLQKIGADVHYHLMPNAKHAEFEGDFVNFIENICS